MTAEFLRETARMMRETAEAATPGPLVVVRAPRGQVGWCVVADWLDDLARLSEYGDTGGPRVWGHALAVARAWRADQ